MDMLESKAVSLVMRKRWTAMFWFHGTSRQFS